MKTNSRQLAIALYDALATTPAGQHQAVIKSFVELLAEQRMLSASRQIIADFEAYYNQQNNIVPVTVTSPRPISQTDQKKLVQALNHILNKKVELTETVDRTLLGGIKIKLADTIINATLDNQLKKLHNTLTTEYNG